MTITTNLLGTDAYSQRMQVQNYISLWTVRRLDGIVEFYTSHDEDLNVGVVDTFSTDAITGAVSLDAVFFRATFLATSGLSISAARQESGLKSNNVTATGVLGLIEIDEISGRAYEMAQITEYRVDHRWPSMPWFEKHVYWITDVQYSDQVFEFGMEGHGRRVRENIGDPFNRTCRWTLGMDNRNNENKGCGRDRTGDADPGVHIRVAVFSWTNCTVGRLLTNGTSTQNRQQFYINTAGSLNEDDNSEIRLAFPLKYGRIEWTAGANIGQKYDIGDYDETDSFFGLTIGRISQRILTENPIEIGDVCTIREGCDNTFDTCNIVYQNTKNFGGWHLIPGPTRSGQAARVQWT